MYVSTITINYFIIKPCSLSRLINRYKLSKCDKTLIIILFLSFKNKAITIVIKMQPIHVN